MIGIGMFFLSWCVTTSHLVLPIGQDRDLDRYVNQVKRDVTLSGAEIITPKELLYSLTGYRNLESPDIT